ncbi:MAG: hypothetical protein ACKODX_23420 [Gemmata sp.]
MSGRLVSHTRRCQLAALVAAVTVGALVCGAARSQPPTAKQDTKEAGGPLDNRDPLPADSPRRKAFERLQIKDRDRGIFQAAEDFKPVARQDVNRFEYEAWIEFVLHAKNQQPAELNEYAIRDLVPLDLTRSQARRSYRTELLRFDGKLSCVRRLVPPPLLQVQGVAELYEARLVPVDESPLTPVSLVFIDLPESLAAVKAKRPDEWLDADAWVTASGYYFKTMSVPGDQANAVVSIPLLIGRGLTPAAGPPVPHGGPVALEKKRLYEFIKDDTKMIRSSPTEATWPEVAAENRIVLHAARFPAAELELHANADLSFADLFKDSRIAHKLRCVKFEGRLISLKRAPVNDWLAAAGVAELYEGWLIPANEPRGNPMCVLFTEPVPELEPNGRVNQWVTFAGFYFKRMRYESAEPDEKNPGKNVEKYAPLLIGRTAVPRSDPDPPTAGAWGGFIRASLVAGALLILSAGLFTLYYRGGDRKAKAEIDAVRNRNPFDPSAAPPVA